MTTTTKPGLYGLALDAKDLHGRITALAERLQGDDEADVADAIVELEAALLAEESHRDVLNDKADAYCWVIDQLRGQAAWRREQADRLRDLADSDNRKADRLEQTLIRVLTALEPDATKFELPEHRISSRKSQAVEVDLDPAELPECYQLKKTIINPHREALKRDLKAGFLLPGARLVERRSWKIG
jgi:chromosome segregation ATPase